MGERLVIEASVKNLARIRDFVEEWATTMQARVEAIQDLILAVDESATNIITHGYKESPGEVEIFLSVENEEMVVRLLDRAPLFDPTTIPPPDLTIPLEERKIGGLGMYLTRSVLDSCTYCVTEDGRNELTLRKKLK